MKNKTTYILVTVLALGICYFIFINILTESYPVEPSEVRDQLISELEQNSVWYAKEGERGIRFFKSDRNKVLALASSAANLVLPFKRSFSPVPEIFDKYLGCLEQKGIKYEIREVSGKKWVVYESADENITAECLLNGI